MPRKITDSEDWDTAGIDDNISWELFDFIYDYLKKHPALDAFNILEQAIARKADEDSKDGSEMAAHDFGIMYMILDWLQFNRLPEGTDRHNKLFKNIAIFCVNSGLSDKSVRIIDERITVNCPGKKKGEIVGWIKWAKAKPREINLSELEDVAKLAEGR